MRSCPHCHGATMGSSWPDHLLPSNIDDEDRPSRCRAVTSNDFDLRMLPWWDRLDRRCVPKGLVPCVSRNGDASWNVEVPSAQQLSWLPSLSAPPMTAALSLRSTEGETELL